MINTRRISRLAFIVKTFLALFLNGVNAQQRKKKYPELFCLPSDYIGRNIVASGLYEEDLLRSLFDAVFINHLAAFKNQTVLDIGANVGNHACFFARYFKRVLAFEPQEAVFHVLKANVLHNAFNNVDAWNVGIGNRDARLPFWQNISGNLGASSFTKPADAQGAFEQKKELLIKHGDTVFANECKDQTIGLIKIDVEGLEAEVLQGIQQTITTHKPFILFEVTGDETRGQNTLLEMLTAMGYQHFYAIEEKTSHSGSRVKRFVNAVLLGADIYMKPVKKLENRYYQMLLAAPAELLPHKRN
jgi:FkbM family methyltransferase